MSNIYHYTTVSQALDELYEMGFDFDFNIDDSEITQYPDHCEIQHIYIDMRETVIQMMKQPFMGLSLKTAKKAYL